MSIATTKDPKELLMLIIGQKGNCFRPIGIKCIDCPLATSRGDECSNGRGIPEDKIVRYTKAIQKYVERYSKEDLVAYLI